MFKLFTRDSRLVKNSANKDLLNDEVRVIKNAIADFQRAYPKEVRVLECGFPDGGFMFLPFFLPPLHK
jgi:hypothetical protein